MTLTAVPTWFLVKTVTHAALTAAAHSQDITAYTLPAKAAIHACVLRTKTAGSGGGVATLSVDTVIDVATSGGTVLDGKTADALGGWHGPAHTASLIIRSWSTTKTVHARFIADVNVADLTGGEWEVYLLLSKLG